MKWLEEYGVIILVYVGLFGFYLGPQIYDNLRPAKYDCETITIPYETEEQGEGDIEETIQDGEDGEKEICTPDKSGYDTTEEVTVQPVNEIIQLSYDESTFTGFGNKTTWVRGYVFAMKEVPDMGPVWGLMGSLLIITIIFIPIVFSIPQIASALTGGAGVDGHGRIMERAARGAATGGIGAFKLGGKAVSRLRGNKMSGK